MIQTDLTKCRRINQLVSLPKIPSPTEAKKTPIKKDIEANSPFVIIVKKNMTSPVTIKVTVYGMTVCTFSNFYLLSPNLRIYLHISNHEGSKPI